MLIKNINSCVSWNKDQSAEDIFVKIAERQIIQKWIAREPIRSKKGYKMPLLHTQDLKTENCIQYWLLRVSSINILICLCQSISIYQYGRHLFDNFYAWLKSQIQINPYQPKYLRILHSHRVGWCQIVKYQHRQVRWFTMLSRDSLLWGQLSEEIPLKCIALTASYIFKHRQRQSRELLVCYHYVMLLLFKIDANYKIIFYFLTKSTFFSLTGWKWCGILFCAG